MLANKFQYCKLKKLLQKVELGSTLCNILVQLVHILVQLVRIAATCNTEICCVGS